MRTPGTSLMSAQARISAAFRDALCLPLNRSSKYIIVSDCHRGTGKTGDNFLKNEYLYLAALNYYFRKGFTYLELGDGDELWENRSVKKIKAMHEASFELLSRYYQDGRLYALFGNHDIIKQNDSFLKKYFHSYNCSYTRESRPLCPDIRYHSGIILQDCERKKDICLTHGHQADILNSTFWRLSRFLVRYVWRPLEALGIPDPTSAAKNNTKKDKTEQILTDWAIQNGCMLITGHTHRPMIGTKNAPYCNSGSCVSPGSITCIEIENRCLTLVKWSMKARSDLTLYAAREVLGDTVCLDDY